MVEKQLAEINFGELTDRDFYPSPELSPRTLTSQPAASPSQNQSNIPQSQRTQVQNTQSALEILAGDMANFQPPSSNASTATPAVNASRHIGIWNAKTQNQSTITLTLKQDGSFLWEAQSQGKRSQFDGRYSLENGKSPRQARPPVGMQRTAVRLIKTTFKS